jgi:hypothetical protein
LLSAAIKAKEEQEYSVKATHLKNLNQPKTKYDDDSLSIDSGHLFERQDLSPAKPLLIAAIKARENALQEEYSKSGTHLNGLNQPSYSFEEKSVDDDDLFDQPLAPPPAKPLLAAAVLAREQSKQKKHSKEARHLEMLNQPKSIWEEKSIDDDDLFDEPLEPPARKPLLTAAYKAREQQRSQVHNSRGNGSNTAHLRYVNQPRFTHDDDDTVSLAIAEVFDPPSPRHRKPLLAAAQQAKEKHGGGTVGSPKSVSKSPRKPKSHRKTTKRSVAVLIPDHLQTISQPSVTQFEDDGSLNMTDLFDPPKPPPPAKPLLSAAMKAKDASLERKRMQHAIASSGVSSSPKPSPVPIRRPASMNAKLVRKSSLEQPGSKKVAKVSTTKKPSDMKSGSSHHSPRRKKKATTTTSSKEKQGSSTTANKKDSSKSSDGSGGGLFSKLGKKSH